MSFAKTGTYRTFSSDETKKLGHDVGRKLSRSKLGATVLALRGDLGAGKTTFVQGLMKGIGSKKRAASPTFILMRRHRLSGAGSKSFKNAYHIDAYRLKTAEQFRALELDGIMKDSANIILIEWPEKAKLPRQAMRLLFKHGKKEHERVITIK